jgi:hypothetical protein
MREKGALAISKHRFGRLKLSSGSEDNPNKSH